MRLSLRATYVSVLIAGSIAALIYAISFGLGDFSNPGPGMWPSIGSAVMLIGATLLLVPGQDSSDEYETIGRKSLEVVLGLAMAIAWTALTSLTGIIIATFIFFYLWLTFISGESQRLTIVVSLAAAFAIYIVFDVLLGAPFPAGFLERLIGL